MDKIKIINRKVFIISGVITCLFLYFLFSTHSAIISHPDDRALEWLQATDNAQFPGRSGHKCVVFKNMLWIIGGWDGSNGFNDIWNSSDGTKWKCVTNKAPFTPRAGHSLIVYNNKIWLIGGMYFNRNKDIKDLNDVWNSSDGFTWKCVTRKADFPSRGGHASAVFKKRMWVIGGMACNADIWYSINGKNWYRTTANAAFKSRGGHTTIVFNNKLWVIGGLFVDRENMYHSLKDVWFSDDGINWKKSYEDTSPFAGGGISSVIYNNKIWVIGGFRRSGKIFSSADGSNWIRVDDSPAFGERVSHNSVLYNNKIWIIGGFVGSGHKNDIWYSNEINFQSLSSALW